MKQTLISKDLVFQKSTSRLKGSIPSCLARPSEIKVQIKRPMICYNLNVNSFSTNLLKLAVPEYWNMWNLNSLMASLWFLASCKAHCYKCVRIRLLLRWHFQTFLLGIHCAIYKYLRFINAWKCCYCFASNEEGLAAFYVSLFDRTLENSQ